MTQTAEALSRLPRAPVAAVALPRGPWAREVGEALSTTGLRLLLVAEERRLLDVVAHHRPDLALLHERTVAAPVAAVEGALRREPHLRVLYVCRVPREDELLALLRAGAWGYTSEAAPATVARCVLAVARGEVVVPRRMVGRLTAELRSRAVGRDPGRGWVTVAGLTPREWEALDLLRADLSTAAIARRMHVSQATVRSHLHEAMRKLRVRDREELRATLERRS